MRRQDVYDQLRAHGDLCDVGQGSIGDAYRAGRDGLVCPIAYREKSSMTWAAYSAGRDNRNAVVAVAPGAVAG